MRKLLLALALSVALGACAPVASWLAGAVEDADGATLTFVQQGVQFDPGESVARGLVLLAQGENLELLSVPPGTTCTVTSEKLDCRTPVVSAPVQVGLRGQGVTVSVTFRRVGAGTVYRAFAP